MDALRPWAWRDYESRRADKFDRWHQLKRRLRSVRIASALCGILAFAVGFYWGWTGFTNLQVEIVWAALGVVGAISELHVTILDDQLRRFEVRDVESV